MSTGNRDLENWEYACWMVSDLMSPKRWSELRDEILECYVDELWAESCLASVFVRCWMQLVGWKKNNF